MVDRRRFLAELGLGAFTLSAGACNFGTSPDYADTDGRLAARPLTPRSTAAPGLRSLDLDAARDAQLYVPPSYDSSRAVPLLVLLHGAGRDSTEWTSADAFRALLDEFGVAMLCPSSRGATWVPGAREVAFIDQALQATFDRLRVDSSKLGFGGFSDGASFGLSLGMANGDLFSHLLGFSAGYLLDLKRLGKPRIFMSHGKSDGILPYTGAVAIGDSLRSSGYTVDFTSFEGGHTIGTAVARKALEWFTGRAS
jgi:phospholipase/carboxylesterase